MNDGVRKESLDVNQDRVRKLEKLFPEVFTEGKIDFQRLKPTLGEDVIDEDEKYSFTWAGRKDTFRNIQTTAKGTLVPAKDESVDFDNTRNIIIEGDNLEVLKLLQKAYFGRIKMMYIDPPYNTGRDFIYKDNFKNTIQSYLEQTRQTDSNGIRLVTNPETSGRFHSDWISMMYPRLFIARNLLHDNGFIFVSIDDNEIQNLKLIMNEIFGEENYRNTIIVRRYDKNINRQFMENGLVSFNVGVEYVLIYSKDPDAKLNPVFRPASKQRKTKGYWKGFWNDADRPTMRYDILGVTPTRGQWKWKKEVAYKAIENYKEYLGKYSSEVSLEEYWEETGKSKKFVRRNRNGRGINKGVEHWIPPSGDILRNTLWYDIFASKTVKDLEIPFDNPKNPDMIKNFMVASTDEDDIIMDFFAGSGTTAQAMMEQNVEDGCDRKFILVQLPELVQENSQAKEAGYTNIAEICKERVRRVIKGIAGESKAKNTDLGFKVFKLSRSNYKVWQDYQGKSPEELTRQLDLFKTSLVSDYKDADVIYECIIKEGYDLNSKIETVVTETNKAYRISDGEVSFFICLDMKIDDATIERLSLEKDTVFVCLDSALDDSRKANLALQCNLKTI